MKNRITQRDIARELGLDVSTVSLALGGHPRIPETTRARVREASVRLGYRPDPALASIAASRWQGRRSVEGIMLGFLTDPPKRMEVELELYGKGIRQQAELLGYGVTQFAMDTFPSAEAFRRIIQSRGIRGVIVGQSRTPLEEDFFDESVAPIVHCGFLREVRGDMVRPDLRLAVKETCRRLLEAYKRVTLFLPVERELVSDHSILGAALVAENIAAQSRISVVTTGERPIASDFRRLKASRPDCIVTINEKQAIEMQTAWPPARKRPVCTLHTLPPFAGKVGMHLRLETIGRVAVNLLEMKMRRLPLSITDFRQTLLVEPEWLGS